jgi:UDP:flavonoid glycosyltransferase YjiC (YdhE family)
VLDDHQYRDAARRIAERMATTRGVHQLAEIVVELIAGSRRTGLMQQP